VIIMIIVEKILLKNGYLILYQTTLVHLI